MVFIQEKRNTKHSTQAGTPHSFIPRPTQLSHPHTQCGRKSHTDAHAHIGHSTSSSSIVAPEVLHCLSPLALGPLPDETLHASRQKPTYPQSRYHHSLSAEPRFFFGFPSRRAGQSPTLVSPRSANKLRPRANPCINQYWVGPAVTGIIFALLPCSTTVCN
ncbi:hypothetical protein CI102_2684 [Trichoderma harzianum]|nr:hypothetical protein CI102_2684 [Trichoderma harzianum]